MQDYIKQHHTLWSIAWVSFFWSMSSLMIFSILPAFLVDDLKLNYSNIGFIEGIAISFSFIAKFFSGVMSDKIGSRKPLIMAGSLMTVVIKPLFALCNGAFMLGGIRFIDRIAKGIRSAPTDALIADVSSEQKYASHFGIRQSLYIFGEVVGAIVAMLLMLVSHNNYRLVFALASIPALLAVVVLWRVPPLKKGARGILCNRDIAKSPLIPLFQRGNILSLKQLKNFSPAFWGLMLVCFFLMLARFSEGFLTLKAKQTGWPIAYLPFMLIIMNLVHACIALPAGRYADRTNRLSTLLIGLLCMIAAQITLANSTTVFGIVCGVVLVGIHMGITQGLLKALIAQVANVSTRGTAFAVFFMISGLALFLANAIAGKLADIIGINAPFYAGCVFTCIAGILVSVDVFKRFKFFNDEAYNRE